MQEAKIIDGKWLASLVQAEVAAKVSACAAKVGRPPALGVVLVGENPASQVYVAGKEKFAKQCGFLTVDKRLPQSSDAGMVRAAIEDFNSDPAVDGILLQLPLPRHLKANDLISCIDPNKDADGLHPFNQGLMLRGEGTLRPCTPVGAIKLLDLAFMLLAGAAEPNHLEQILPFDLSGKVAVVVGRSILVGKPVSLLLQERNATVIMAHSKTADLPEIVGRADVLVAAVGVPKLIQGNWIKPGAVVIDVGINRQPDGKLAGDVDFDRAKKRAAAITPVPGGVGPMTVAILIYNTLQSYLAQVE